MSSTPAADRPRRAAVLGSPIAHSRSPQLHLAAYAALGLSSWRYDRIECGEDELPGFVAGLGDEWVGLSVTMPGKFAALRCADEATERARLVGSANTLVHTATGWRADNTDIDGVAGALADAGVSGSAVVVGSGGTAPAVVAGLVQLGARHVTVVARNAEKAQGLVALGRRCGATTEWVDLTGDDVTGAVAAADVVVNTVPADAVAPYAPRLAGTPVLLDAIYDPWPTPLAAAVTAAGGRVISGLEMLLNQAFAQVEQFTGMPAPQKAMRGALGLA
ncbi:shikimate dehydrogenase [Mycolicibacterium gilvum]|uniref:shikimate dehydrogenase (NADP(+)) n=1 Tax=Mycolicibacterium gilvum (strain DSM 45189 / LMG 24558 / Spyr1) TaxID=278137 RepID=E6TCF1_MYCSR|nr:shikimate dehydrogenase [Mycolicibacterium gilvum]ADT99718.1 shikimate dehydrogenase [Mycolicibacterium gilvum Spyr1]